MIRNSIFEFESHQILLLKIYFHLRFSFRNSVRCPLMNFLTFFYAAAEPSSELRNIKQKLFSFQINKAL